MILFYSRDADSFVNEVIDNLDKDYLRIGDLDTIRIEHIVVKEREKSFKISGSHFNSIDLNQVTAIWFNGGVAKSTGSEYENQCYSLLIDSFLHQKKVTKIGRLKKSFEINKLDMQMIAQEFGFKTPQTLITNNKIKLEAFYKKFESKNGIICKRITDSIYYKNEEFVYDFTPTFIINNEIFKSIPDNFAVSLFQERIAAEFEIRVVFIFGDIYSMSIHNAGKSVDYRRELKNNEKIRAITFHLPKKVRNQIRKIFTSIDMNYGSVDLMYYKNEFYFLEINPIGLVGFVNNYCNFYLEKKISKILQNEV